VISGDKVAGRLAYGRAVSLGLIRHRVDVRAVQSDRVVDGLFVAGPDQVVVRHDIGQLEATVAEVELGVGDPTEGTSVQEIKMAPKAAV